MGDLSYYALLVARLAHRGQVDKLGVDYIEHPKAVADICITHGYDEETIATAFLHDVIEDTFWCTTAVLKEMNFPDSVIEAVDLLTRKKGVPDEEYYTKISKNKMAERVKRADIMHNTDPVRLAQLPPEVRARLTKKYIKGLRFMGDS